MHYNDPNYDLKDMYFINPSWLCRLMAKIITVEAVHKYIRNGILKTGELRDFIIREGGDFPPTFYNKYLRLLYRFQIACPIDSMRALVPSKLPVNPIRVVRDPEDRNVLSRSHVFSCIPFGFWERLISRLLLFMKDMLAPSSSEEEDTFAIDDSPCFSAFPDKNGATNTFIKQASFSSNKITNRPLVGFEEDVEEEDDTVENEEDEEDILDMSINQARNVNGVVFVSADTVNAAQGQQSTPPESRLPSSFTHHHHTVLNGVKLDTSSSTQSSTMNSDASSSNVPSLGSIYPVSGSSTSQDGAGTFSSSSCCSTGEQISYDTRLGESKDEDSLSENSSLDKSGNACFQPVRPFNGSSTTLDGDELDVADALRSSISMLTVVEVDASIDTDPHMGPSGREESHCKGIDRNDTMAKDKASDVEHSVIPSPSEAVDNRKRESLSKKMIDVDQLEEEEVKENGEQYDNNGSVGEGKKTLSLPLTEENECGSSKQILANTVVTEDDKDENYEDDGMVAMSKSAKISEIDLYCKSGERPLDDTCKLTEQASDVPKKKGFAGNNAGEVKEKTMNNQNLSTSSSSSSLPSFNDARRISGDSVFGSPLPNSFSQPPVFPTPSPTSSMPRTRSSPSSFNEFVDVAHLFDEGILTCWKTGITFKHPKLFFSVCKKRAGSSSSSNIDKNENTVLTKVSNNSIGHRVLGYILDHIRTLIKEWYPGLSGNDGEKPYVEQFAACPVCMRLGSKDPHMFNIQDAFSKIYIHKESDNCLSCVRLHNPQVVDIEMLCPELLFKDLSKDLQIPRDKLDFEDHKDFLLGEGGFGKVYRGTLVKSKDNQIPVAIKLYNFGDPVNAQDGFHEIRQEIFILSKLRDHQFIIKFMGFVIEPRLCALMELARHGNLHKALTTENGNLKAIHRVVHFRIVKQLASAMSFMHHLRIIHRDIKSDNILVFSTSPDAEVLVKLTDFGTANFLTPDGMKNINGTPGYRAPEMFNFISSDEYTTKVDIYSFAMVVGELITGRRPFHSLVHHQIPDALKRLERPRYTDIEVSMFGLLPLTELMTKMWQQEITKRPNADQVLKQAQNPAFQLFYGKRTLDDPQNPKYLCAMPSSQEIWIVCDNREGNLNVIISLFFFIFINAIHWTQI